MNEFNIPKDLVHKLPSYFDGFNKLTHTYSNSSMAKLSAFFVEFKEVYDTAQSVRYGDYVRNNHEGCFF